jgi:hypothetical protein
MGYGRGQLNAYLDKCLDNVSNKNFSITKKPMFVRVQNLESMSVLDTEIGNPIGLTGMTRAHTSLAGPPTSLTSLAIIDWRRPIIDWRKPIIDWL